MYPMNHPQNQWNDQVSSEGANIFVHGNSCFYIQVATIHEVEVEKHLLEQHILPGEERTWIFL